MVGISNPSGEPDGYWVCQPCFEKWLGAGLELANNLVAFLDGESPEPTKEE